MARSYRSRSQVIGKLLSTIASEGPVGVTRLTAMANLTHARIQEHLSDFEQGGLTVPATEGDRTTWTITDKGRKALEELRRIERAMQDFGLNL